MTELEPALRNRRDLADRKDLKRQRRQAQLEARARYEAAARRRRLLIWGGGVAAAVLAFAALVYWLVGPQSGSGAQTFRVQTIPIQGQQHVPRGQQHPPYNSKPPTSGWHYGDAVAPWGVATEQIPDEVQVHNLEHGGIMIQYDCPGGAAGCPEMVAQLEQIVRSYRSKVILAPYQGIGHPIALTAWRKLAYLDRVDEAFIRRFIDTNKDKGPERVPD